MEQKNLHIKVDLARIRYTAKVAMTFPANKTAQSSWNSLFDSMNLFKSSNANTSTV